MTHIDITLWLSISILEPSWKITLETIGFDLRSLEIGGWITSYVSEE